MRRIGRIYADLVNSEKIRYYPPHPLHPRSIQSSKACSVTCQCADLPRLLQPGVLLDHGDADVLGQRAAQATLHPVGQILHAPALQVGILRQVKHDVAAVDETVGGLGITCLLYTSPSPRDRTRSRMPSSA